MKRISVKYNARLCESDCRVSRGMDLQQQPGNAKRRPANELSQWGRAISTAASPTWFPNAYCTQRVTPRPMTTLQFLMSKI
mmetsp:Transcript_48564/g.113722  ORF Transcript_48564/g.113722 Transcript_48564/m.113722 type:complete len:81 (+) Transcript_48564:1121-1363(+)